MNHCAKFEHPAGSVQGICSSSVGLLALLIAFVSITGYGSIGASSPWRLGDLWHLGLSLLAALLLASVPWLATKPQPPEKLSASLQHARMCLAAGTLCAMAAIMTFLVRSFLGNFQ